MKTPLLIFILMLSVVSVVLAQRYEFGVGYTFTAPIATMKHNINQGNGLTMDLYVLPAKNNRLALGVDMNYSVYGYDSDRQVYTLSDGTQAPMDIVVDNTFVNLLVGARYYLKDVEEKSVKPYITLKGGYAWFRTNLNIYDPDDNDHCEPVDNDLLMKDGTLLISGGAGFHWNLSTVFKKKAPNRFLFNVGANLTLGGKVSYMNTDAPDPVGNHPYTDVNAQFINTQTHIVHEHHVGYVYTSFVEMIEVRAGFIFRRGLHRSF